jgi:hypothetical protein
LSIELHSCLEKASKAYQSKPSVPSRERRYRIVSRVLRLRLPE